MQEIVERIREEARRLLQGKAVDVVVGYRQGWDEGVAAPCFVTDQSQVDRLIFDENCTHNLAKYLVGIEGLLTSRFRGQSERPRVALVALPATLRTVVGLIQEQQIQREDLVLLGVVNGMPNGLEPDIVVGHATSDPSLQEQTSALLLELESMSVLERRAYWDQELTKCIRCYACRQVCPFCYCEQCVADENQPQWVQRSPSLANNMAWNVVRALHLAGRCTNCGE